MRTSRARTGLRWAIAGLAGALTLAAGPASAGSLATEQPVVRSASLVQDGRQLLWTVRFARPLSVGDFRREKSVLCLLVERGQKASVSGVLCVEMPAGPRRPGLLYSRVSAQGAGRARAIEAAVSLSGSRELRARFLPSAIGLAYSSLRWQVISPLSGPLCGPAAPTPAGCTTLVPTRPVLARLHSPRLIGCVPSGPSFVFHGASRRRVVALTFDDGPWPDTPQFLSVLEREHVQATFFQIGEQVGSYGRSVDRRMLSDGDMIGDHTWNHADVSGGGSFAAAEVAQAAGAIHQATGFTPCLFRAPGGAVSGSLISLARSVGFTTIQWDVDPRDWARPGTAAIYQNVTANAHGGAIVIQHDGGGDRSETLAALPHEIDTLRREGYGFVTVTELLGQRLLYR